MAAAADFIQVQTKYAQEAQKRVKPEKLAQFQEIRESKIDRLRHLADDFWADHAALDAQTPPLKEGDCPKFLIAGAGVGGIVAAVRLIQQGFTADQIRLIDNGGGIGGTWYWNRYPGLNCDVESYIYMPLLEEMGYMPSHKYVSGVEIRHYLEDVVKKYQLDDKILFRSYVEQIAWDDEARQWKVEVTTGRGPSGQERASLSVRSEFFYMTAGVLGKPQIPKIGGVGLEGFKGDMFHTSLWNYDVTGGSPEDIYPELSKLKDKVVGIVGTGATAIQVVPYLAKYAKEVYVFQRTPSAVYPRGQRKTDAEEWAKSIATGPGWYDARQLNFSQVMARCLPEGEPNLVDDAWSHLGVYAALTGDPEFAAVTPADVPRMLQFYLEQELPVSAGVRQRVKDIVKDAETAEKLMAWYPIWCKRGTFSDSYLQAFNEPHVHLVDTDGEGLDSATPNGVVANGKEYGLDTLVLSTGYISPASDGGDPSIRAGIRVYGRDGRTLSQKFNNHGVATLYGVTTNGFPNLFWLGVAQSCVNANHAYVLDILSRISAYMVGAGHAKVGDGSKTQRGVTVEVDVAAEEAWSMRILQGAARFATMTVCTPSYITAEMGPGNPGEGKSQEELIKLARRSPWPAGMPAFMEVFAKWRDEGNLEGMTVKAAAA
ncbi:FAD/NAD(P)-binding domain-containing protein [Poronia punctata]|nr:FAD/NAD(P)-binding domain-containing protein [Poronia punctata]